MPAIGRSTRRSLPRLSTEVPPVYILSTPGSWAHRRCTSGRCEQGGYQHRLGWPARSDHAALLNWTSDKASADTATSKPISILAWWLVRQGQRLTQNKYPKLLVHWGSRKRAETHDKVTPSPRLMDLRQGHRLPGRAMWKTHGC